MATKPKSLVTGACGFTGTHVVEELVAAGHEVVATDLARSMERDDPKAHDFPSVLRDLGIEPVPADVRDRASLERVIDQEFDYVFHVASVFNYSAPWEVYRSVNVDGTRNLLEVLARRSPSLKRFVLWGAGGVYGLPDYQDGPFTEDMPPAPPNDYLRSKWFQEHLTMDFCKAHKIPWTILRPTTVYGPRQVYGFGELLMNTAKQKVVMVPGSLTGKVPMVHVRDVSGAALHLATISRKKGVGIFNLNDDTVMSSVDLMRYIAEVSGHVFVELPKVPLPIIKAAARAVAEVTGRLAKVLPGFTPPIEAPTVDYLGVDFAYDNGKLKATGYRFRYPDARLGIKETLDWYRDQGWLG